MAVEEIGVTFKDNTQIPLEKLCAEMSKFPLLERSKVVATECYVTDSIVHHRFIILEIRCPDGLIVWIRIDRLRTPGSLVGFVLNLSITPAYDMVHFFTLNVLFCPNVRRILGTVFLEERDSYPIWDSQGEPTRVPAGECDVSR